MKKTKVKKTKIGKPGSEFKRSAKHAGKRPASVKSTSGKLIVIDGTDGSGKATQIELLRERLKSEGYKVRTVDFPEYYKNFFGKFVGHCLAEQYFNWVNIHPKIASVMYAADRWESKGEMEGWIKKGYVVLANRYVSANQIHQGGKIKSAKKREEFLNWLSEMEYKVFGIPKPDITLYLSLPIPIVLKLIKSRNVASARAYLGKKKDVHEKDKNFLENSRKSALWLSKTLPGFIKIECSRKEEIMSREAIHEMVYKEVKKVVK
jgi:dTMP kinase